ncbi:MAG: hypothetical protein U5L96_05505 [Owenweeksia sp.]|nr:hypothetical protein [Owenweeksia sp.]
MRDDESKNFDLKLRNMEGTTAVISAEEASFGAKLGADLEPLYRQYKTENWYHIRSGGSKTQ